MLQFSKLFHIPSFIPLFGGIEHGADEPHFRLPDAPRAEDPPLLQDLRPGQEHGDLVKFGLGDPHAGLGLGPSPGHAHGFGYVPRAFVRWGALSDGRLLGSPAGTQGPVQDALPSPDKSPSP